MTCYLSEPGVEFEISTFFVNIFKNRSKFKKMKKPLLDNFILFLKINESHFLIKPNFCYAVQEKLDGYHGYWCISAKLHNFTKICGYHWIHLVFLIPEMYTFVHFCASLLSIMRCIRRHISFFRLGLTPTLIPVLSPFSLHLHLTPKALRHCILIPVILLSFHFLLIPRLWGCTTPLTQIIMFCALSQNYQHFFGGKNMHLMVKYFKGKLN